MGAVEMKDKIKFINAMLIFGTIGVFVKNINLSSMEIAFLRAVIGCAFLVAAGFFMHQKISFEMIKKNKLLLILSGAAIGFNWLFLFQAYKYTTIANATISYYFAPMFVVILSPLILKESITVFKFACVAGAMVGLFLILNSNNEALVMANNQVLGIAYGLLAASFYAGIVLMNKFIKGLSGFETTLIQLMIAAIVLFPFIMLQGGIKLSVLSVYAVILILFVGIVHTGLAYLIYFTSMKDIQAQTIAVLSYIDPITAVVISAVFLGEALTLYQAAGGILILGAAFLSESGERLLGSLKKRG